MIVHLVLNDKVNKQGEPMTVTADSVPDLPRSAVKALGDCTAGIPAVALQPDKDQSGHLSNDAHRRASPCPDDLLKYRNPCSSL